MNMDALAARIRQSREERGLIAKDGTAAATAAQKAYYDFRHDMRQRSDWGALPADLEKKLIRLRNAARVSA